MKVLGICGSSASSCRTKALIESALSGAISHKPETETDIICLSDFTLDFCDGRPIEEYNESTQTVLENIKNADAYLFGSPMYRGSMTGALKNLLDLIPNDYVKGKAAGMIATGGSDHHYLGMDLGFRSAMAFFQMHTIPGVLYQSKFTVDNEGIVEEKIKEHAGTFGRDVLQLAEFTKGRVLGPSLY